jgi:predicted amidophosphoribosyltransferase
MGLQGILDHALRAIYPPTCLTCDALVTTEFGLCGTCWRDTPFISGLVCDLCGAPLPGEDPGQPVHCDDCLTLARPWDQGRSALLYRDNGRRIVLSLKHGDRTDLARPAAAWLGRSAGPLFRPGMIVAPVPLHVSRLFTRRYNQSALLSAIIARAVYLTHIPDLLQRKRNTRSQEGRDRDGRFRNVEGAMRLHPRHGACVVDRPVLLIDDVMTSGATLATAAETCRAGGASYIAVLSLARVAKDS